jgi:signal transduction histidine kinase
MTMPSIQRRLLVWILGALTAGAILLVFVTYFVALSEIDEILVENLKQVALSVASHELVGRRAEPPVPMMGPALEDLDFAIVSWAADGRLVFSSDPRVMLPFDTAEGHSRVQSNGEEWQVFTVRQGDAIVQAAQRVAAREFEAAEVAAKLVPVLILLVLLIGLLLVAALRRGLGPLEATADHIGALTAQSLEPIPAAEVPRELHSMILAINRLMQRLSEAFAAQRRFVADAAHELRTPITALKLQAQLLERAKGPGERAGAMADLREGLARAERLIAQLLALSRLEPGDWQHEARAVDVGLLIREAVLRLSVQADAKGIDLGAEAGENLFVDGDAEQLLVLVNNLLQNALRHTPAGGAVSVGAAQKAGQGVVLSVVDEGPGIPESERTRVFDRFYRGMGDGTAPDAPVGSGLGLSIVKAIADRHGASIAFGTPAAGPGLEVRVAFPPCAHRVTGASEEYRRAA